MPLSPQTRLGPYEILSPIGAGGMGEVYKAKDTRLDRTVAIKVLPEHVAGNPEARQRFEREARAVSSLNHPNICVLHDIGQQDGIDFLVMEYLEGETLAARLAKGPLPVPQALEYAIQIADALAQAHRRGFCHRDLKPGNIMLTKSGAKLLDFGLAKRAPTTLANEATVSADLTGRGSLIGTLPYMAPEQVEGREADTRTDLFAFGSVLYEMVTGRKAFTGQTAASLMAAILERDPPPLPGSCPAALDRVLKRCLAKDPEERWQSAHDLASELRWIGQEGETAGRAIAPPSQSPTRPLAWMAATALAALAAAILGGLYLRKPPPPTEQPARFAMTAPEGATLYPYSVPVVSPDGVRLAFVGVRSDGSTQLWTRSLDSVTAEPLAGTGSAIVSFWSPDSRSLAFIADAKLKKIDLRGGAVQTLCDASGGGGSGAWNRDGVILFNTVRRPELYRVPATGGVARQVTTIDASHPETAHYGPQFLPDGRHFLYSVGSGRDRDVGIYAGLLDSPEKKRLLSADGSAAFAMSPSGSGHLLFVRGSTLMAQTFDAGKLELKGEPYAVAEPVYLVPSPIRDPYAVFSASENGVLAYREGSATFAMTELVWFDRQGKRLGTLREPGEYSNPALSAAEKKVVVGRMNLQSRSRDLWVSDVARNTSSRFTFDPADETDPAWSPDGSRVAYAVVGADGHRDIYQKAAGGQADPLLVSSESKSLMDWFPDGSFVLFGLGQRMWELPLGGDRKPKGPFGQGSHARFSPDGRWIAYDLTESGRTEVYVQSFPPSGGTWQVSKDGGIEPYWRRDGKELFFITGDNKLAAVAVKTDGQIFEAGVPQPLFQVRLEAVARQRRYQVAANGQRFLLNVPVGGSSAPITVVLNWTAALKR